MKAVQIRYLGPTDHRGTRIKVWAPDVKAKIYGRDYAIDFREQAKQCAVAYCGDLDWPSPTGFGMLPNGDYVATLGTMEQ